MCKTLGKSLSIDFYFTLKIRLLILVGGSFLEVSTTDGSRVSTLLTVVPAEMSSNFELEFVVWSVGLSKKGDLLISARGMTLSPSSSHKYGSIGEGRIGSFSKSIFKKTFRKKFTAELNCISLLTVSIWRMGVRSHRYARCIVDESDIVNFRRINSRNRQQFSIRLGFIRDKGISIRVSGDHRIFKCIKCFNMIPRRVGWEKNQKNDQSSNDSQVYKGNDTWREISNQ